MRSPVYGLLLIVPLLSACATVPYEYGRDIETPATLQLAAGEPQIERGRPHALLDGLGHYILSLPSKILLLNWKVDNHNISDETEEAIREYLAANCLQNVKVRINQYAPGREWSRLARNQEINPFWRWTIGALSLVFYSALPQRAFGGDNYNPFTNTINLYSDSNAIALHEAGHSKDFAKTEWKGLYAALRILPLFPLLQEGRATADAIGYEREQRSGEDEKSAYRTLYPAYGTYIGGEAAQWVRGANWVSYAVQFGAVIPGHIIGWTRSLFVEDRPQPVLSVATPACP